MGNVIKPKNDDIVRKSEAITKARYKLNPLALKFITTIIANIKRSDDTDKRYVFRVKDFAELTGSKYAEIYNELEEAVEELLKKPLHIKTESGWLKANWISSARYEAGEGKITFRVDSELRPYLLALQEKFLQYRLENILKLKSGYVIRLYEILKDWYGTFSRNSKMKKIEKIIEVKWLRETLEISKGYRYNDIKRIIERAKKDLFENTDIKFDYEEIKTGRKVTHLKFIVEPNLVGIENKENQEPYGFLKSKKRFVTYLRKHYVNRPIIEAPNKKRDGQLSRWSISENGLIYDMRLTEDNINATRSDEIYSALYEFAKSNEEFAQKLANRE
ncbi:replication initiation protein [Nitratiruptor sp. YY09-18]|uniref:replication initiation protein n=1 Tax=Nitratiruptor sp. YY09-18 TaxID=2724901 RepID=UPI0018EC4298|nr:replication initiation protein [Nitratiruptor sp. YY09-18]BCD68948.1 hypothetical protein NitYY0918_P15 [Nitratiruptor sp. YY09-18]